MQDVELHALNLNQLVALDALFEEGSVTRAAARIGVSQSAMSQSLAKLRALFDDPLLVRKGREMVPTPKGERLLGPLHEALGDLRRTVRDALHFDPRTSKRRFVLGMSDLAAALLLPAVLARLATRARGVELVVEPVAGAPVARFLAEGRWDLAFPGWSTASPSLREEALFTDRLACVVRRGHPAVRAGGFDLPRFRKAWHVVFQGVSQAPREIFEIVRAGADLLHTPATVPYLLALPLLVQGADFVATVPARLAAGFAHDPALAVVPAPPEFPLMTQIMVTHERFAEDPGLAWLRRQFREVAAELPSG